MESAFIGSSIKLIFVESTEYLSDMFAVKVLVVRVDEYIIKVDNYTNVGHIGEDIIHKSLKSGWSVGESEQHDQPFKQPVTGSECGFPLITFGNAD